jgi:hypothetical protein
LAVHVAGRKARHGTRSYAKGDAGQDRAAGAESRFFGSRARSGGRCERKAMLIKNHPLAMKRQAELLEISDRRCITCRRGPRSETSLLSARGRWVRDFVALRLARRYLISRKMGRARSESMTITFAIHRLGNAGPFEAVPREPATLRPGRGSMIPLRLRVADFRDHAQSANAFRRQCPARRRASPARETRRNRPPGMTPATTTMRPFSFPRSTANNGQQPSPSELKRFVLNLP